MTPTLTNRISFREIIGHSRQIGLLMRALARDRLAHAFLFVGSEGIGKRQVALTFAAALNCTAEAADPCQHCANCTALARGEHPDVALLAPEKQTIKIDAVRDLRRRLHYGALLGRRKVIIIDDAHTLGEAAANALLKTLEEPSPDTVFILVTHSADRLLDTIHSRCQTLYFSTLDRRQVADFLVAGGEVDREAASLIAAMSEGSLSRASELADGELMQTRREVLERLQLLPTCSVDDLFTTAAAWSNEPTLLNRILDLLRLYFRDLVLIKEQVPTQLLSNGDLQSTLHSHAAMLSDTLALAHLDLVRETQTLLERNVNARLAVEHLLIALKYGLTPPPLLSS